MNSKAARLTGYALTGAFTLFMLFDVAIKLIRPELFEHPELRARFEEGARVVAGVAHPGVVALHDPLRATAADAVATIYVPFPGRFSNLAAQSGSGVVDPPTTVVRVVRKTAGRRKGSR